MSTEIADWKKDLASAAQKTAKEERPGVGFISLRSGVMSYMDEPIPGNQLECIIITNTHERTYYDKPFDADDKSPPACFSQSVELNTLAPHANVVAPIHPSCKGCRLAEFGTAVQGKGPACRNYRKLVITPVSSLKDGLAGAELAVLKVSPTSVKNFSQYAGKVASLSGLPVWAIKTMITVKPHPKKQFEITFQTTGKIEEDKYLSVIHSRIAEAELLALTPFVYEDDEVETTKKATSSKY